MSEHIHIDMAEIEAALARSRAALEKIAPQNDTCGAQSRMSLVIDQAFGRHMAEEINRGTSVEMTSDALACVCSNMICNLVESSLDPDAALVDIITEVNRQLAKTALFLKQRFEGKSFAVSENRVYPQNGGTA